MPQLRKFILQLAFRVDSNIKSLRLTFYLEPAVCTAFRLSSKLTIVRLVWTRSGGSRSRVSEGGSSTRAKEFTTTTPTLPSGHVSDGPKV